MIEVLEGAELAGEGCAGSGLVLRPRWVQLSPVSGKYLTIICLGGCL